jgi:hypothetical protein
MIWVEQIIELIHICFLLLALTKSHEKVFHYWTENWTWEHPKKHDCSSWHKYYLCYHFHSVYIIVCPIHETWHLLVKIYLTFFDISIKTRKNNSCFIFVINIPGRKIKFSPSKLCNKVYCPAYWCKYYASYVKKLSPKKVLSYFFVQSFSYKTSVSSSHGVEGYDYVKYLYEYFSWSH